MVLHYAYGNYISGFGSVLDSSNFGKKIVLHFCPPPPPHSCIVLTSSTPYSYPLLPY